MQADMYTPTYALLYKWKRRNSPNFQKKKKEGINHHKDHGHQNKKSLDVTSGSIKKQKKSMLGNRYDTSE